MQFTEYIFYYRLVVEASFTPEEENTPLLRSLTDKDYFAT